MLVCCSLVLLGFLSSHFCFIFGNSVMSKAYHCHHQPDNTHEKTLNQMKQFQKFAAY